MRKHVIPAAPDVPETVDGWLDIEDLVDVELTSEDPEHPVEGALLPGRTTGWRAVDPGPQTIRIVFTAPQPVRRILLEFAEPVLHRTQEFVLRWSADGGDTFRDIVRQQWNFSPDGANRQVEEHRVELAGVTVLELTVVPDISGGDARASLERLRLA